jgi:hypothetical protein
MISETSLYGPEIGSEDERQRRSSITAFVVSRTTPPGRDTLLALRRMRTAALFGDLPLVASWAACRDDARPRAVVGSQVYAAGDRAHGIVRDDILAVRGAGADGLSLALDGRADISGAAVKYQSPAHHDERSK